MKGPVARRYRDDDVAIDSLSSTDDELEANLDHWCSHIEDGNVHHLLHKDAHEIPHANHPDYVAAFTDHQREGSLDEEALAHKVAMRVVAMQETRASMVPAQSSPQPLEAELSAAIATFERVVSALGTEHADGVDGDDEADEEEWIVRTRGSVAGKNVLERAASMAEMLRQLIAGSLAPSADAVAEADEVLSGLVGSGSESTDGVGAQAAREQKRRAPPRQSEVGRADGVLAELFVDDFKEALGGDVARFKQFRRASRDFTQGTMSATHYVSVFKKTLEGNEPATRGLAPRLAAILPTGSAALSEELREALAAEDLVGESSVSLDATLHATLPTEDAAAGVLSVATEMEEFSGMVGGVQVAVSAPADAPATEPAPEGAPATTYAEASAATRARALSCAPRGALEPIAEDPLVSADGVAAEERRVATETAAPSEVPGAPASAPDEDAPPALIRAAPPSPFASLVGSAAEAPAAAPSVIAPGELL